MARDPVPADVTVVALVLAVLFVLTSLAFVVRAIYLVRGANPVLHTLGNGAESLMALGMALMLVAVT